MRTVRLVRWMSADGRGGKYPVVSALCVVGKRAICSFYFSAQYGAAEAASLKMGGQASAHRMPGPLIVVVKMPLLFSFRPIEGQFPWVRYFAKRCFLGGLAYPP